VFDTDSARVRKRRRHSNYSDGASDEENLPIPPTRKPKRSRNEREAASILRGVTSLSQKAVRLSQEAVSLTQDVVKLLAEKN
jgi:hypothetical protein